MKIPRDLTGLEFTLLDITKMMLLYHRCGTRLSC